MLVTDLTLRLGWMDGESNPKVCAKPSLALLALCWVDFVVGDRQASKIA
jgi:hypothetical protein